MKDLSLSSKIIIIITIIIIILNKKKKKKGFDSVTLVTCVNYFIMDRMKHIGITEYNPIRMREMIK